MTPKQVRQRAAEIAREFGLASKMRIPKEETVTGISAAESAAEAGFKIAAEIEAIPIPPTPPKRRAAVAKDP